MAPTPYDLSCWWDVIRKRNNKLNAYGVLTSDTYSKGTLCSETIYFFCGGIENSKVSPREVVGITVVVGCYCQGSSHGIREVWNSPVLISEEAAYKYTSVG